MALDLTVVIPCYREGTHIAHSFPELLAALHRSRLDFEVIFIDDGSPDDTVEKLTALTATEPRTRLVCNEKNLGRGGTVMKGIRMSSAKVAGFIDIDLSTPPLYVPHLAAVIAEDRVDVATCRRSYKIEPHVFHKVWLRYILSYGYRVLGRWVLGHGLADTETGCKFFHREKILPVLERIEDPRWFWDTEVMVYSWLAGLRIVEVNSIFVRRPEKPSTVKVAHDVAEYLRNLVAFRRRIRPEARELRLQESMC
jgi:glycosyltransferase involved in cell wall biosynthesis